MENAKNVKCTKGICTFGIPIKWKKPRDFKIHFLEKNILTISCSEANLRFALQHSFLHDKDLQKVLNSCFDGIGFLLNLSIVETSHKTESTSYLGNEQLENYQHNDQITFIYEITTFNEPSNHLSAEKNNMVEMRLKRMEIEKLVSKLYHDERLRDAVYHYLHAIEEPELFLVSLYRAYERIKEFRVIPKKEASNFRKLANFEPIWESRHASDEQMVGLRFLTREERVFCLETIKAGIIKYSESTNI